MTIFSKIELKKELAKRRARNSLLSFTKYTKEDYLVNWHHKSYAAVLDRFIKGKIKRLMVFMPPQHGKSELCSRRMPAKILGDYPNKRIGVIAYNYTFASKFNRDIQRIIDSPEYAELYPDTKLSSSNVRTDAKGSWLRNSDEFEIVGKMGSLISVGTGGGLTGNKLDIAIVDDPYKDAAQANSATYRSKLVEWWDSVLETRFHNGSQVCLTFTRWRADDIAGYLLDLEKKGITTDSWTIVKYQGIKEEKSEDPLDERKQGEALWEEMHSQEKLLNQKAKNPSVFYALTQQNPIAKTGNAIKKHWFVPYEIHELPKRTNHLYIDTAQSDKELKNNDPTGILVYTTWKKNIYLVYFVKGYWGITEQCAKIKWIAEKFLQGRSSEICIENKDNAKSVKNLLSKGTGLSIVLENIKGTKLERVENEEPVFESGRVYAPKNESWWKDFEEHCLAFPSTLFHDEEVDVLTGAIRRAFSKKGGIKMIDNRL